ncbi:hypothetical protein IU479_24150 [Nocardia abscessus]|uniref:hypothetical protein n=1 Tax=Nocardia TaxID=1817 RepID=UPI0018961EF3|nr:MULTISPECIES: hypothetical protein [Nocardia]MBF6221196.1 hypothetical protein [Nocardia abscessus]MDE1671274.1 hypothetical protein [Nocardia gipuzkoensis]
MRESTAVKPLTLDGVVQGPRRADGDAFTHSDWAHRYDSPVQAEIMGRHVTAHGWTSTGVIITTYRRG